MIFKLILTGFYIINIYDIIKYPCFLLVGCRKHITIYIGDCVSWALLLL